MASSRQRPFGRNSFNPRLWPHRLQLGVSTTAGGTAARFPRDLQRHLADRTAWLHHASGLSAETASTRGSGRIGFNSVSQQPRAVQLLAFRETYNATWLIERHGFITPAAFRQKQLQPAALAA